VGLISGPGAGPWSLFSFFPKRGMERREALGALRSAPISQPCDRPAFAPSFRDPSALEGGGGPGARGSCEEPCASRRSIRGTRCRRPHLAPSQASRSTTPSIEQGMPSVPRPKDGTREMRITVFARWGSFLKPQRIQNRDSGVCCGAMRWPRGDLLIKTRHSRPEQKRVAGHNGDVR